MRDGSTASTGTAASAAAPTTPGRATRTARCRPPISFAIRAASTSWWRSCSAGGARRPTTSAWSPWSAASRRATSTTASTPSSSATPPPGTARQAARRPRPGPDRMVGSDEQRPPALAYGAEAGHPGPGRARSSRRSAATARSPATTSPRGGALLGGLPGGCASAHLPPEDHPAPLDDLARRGPAALTSSSRPSSRRSPPTSRASRPRARGRLLPARSGTCCGRSWASCG